MDHDPADIERAARAAAETGPRLSRAELAEHIEQLKAQRAWMQCCQPDCQEAPAYHVQVIYGNAHGGLLLCACADPAHVVFAIDRCNDNLAPSGYEFVSVRRIAKS